jgi:putative membrane protein
VHPAQYRGSPMIKRYSDHAANERTFLAWVRTAIAVMAFGFVIERFDLFLKYATPAAAQGMIAPHGGAFANAADLPSSCSASSSS